MSCATSHTTTPQGPWLDQYLANLPRSRRAGVDSIPTLVSGDRKLSGFYLTGKRIRQFLEGRAGTGELNRIEAGGNYGWPVVAGVDTLPGTQPPVLHLAPSLGVGGASFYDGTALVGFRHDLFLPVLDGEHLLRVRFDPADPSRIAGTERLLDGRFGRLRAVVTGPDGGLYVATGNRDGRGAPRPGDDRIIRLTPVR